MNVFVIIVDSWRVDFLGAYGNNWIKTPNLDKFAKEAAVFNEAYSENMPTLPMRQTVFTGRFTLPFRGWQPLDVSIPVLAEVLWDKGFHTCIVSDTFPMFYRKRGGNFYNRGFERTIWVRGQMDSAVTDESIKVDLDRYVKNNGTEGSNVVRNEITNYLRNRKNWKSDEDHFAARVVKESMRLLGENVKKDGKDGLFFWMDIFDPHEPWDPMPPYDTMYGPLLPGDKRIIHPVAREVEGYLTEDEEKHVRNQYAGLCTIVDKWIGVFLDYLREKGYFENSLIIFTSDHGEPLGKGKWGHGIIRKCRPWPYEELAHIPLIVKHPELGEGKKVDSFVQPHDLTATILDYFQLSSLKGIQGKSLLPLLKEKIKTIRDFAISGHYRASWSIRTKEWTYILWWPGLNRTPELYLRKKDPYELENVIEEYPDEAQELELKLRRFIDSLVWK